MGGRLKTHLWAYRRKGRLRGLEMLHRDAEARGVRGVRPPANEEQNMPRYGLHGKMMAQPGQREALVALLLEASRQVAEVPGCEVYIIANAASEPDAIWITEIWESKEAHDASLGLSAVQATIARARPLIAGFGERFESVPLGGKGLA